jgi:hypothetical protein
MPKNLLILKFLFGRDRPRGLLALVELLRGRQHEVRPSSTHRDVSEAGRKEGIKAREEPSSKENDLRPLQR